MSECTHYLYYSNLRFLGKRCDQKCSSGMYGQDCKSNCLCHNLAKCDHVTGACTCPVGLTGTYCNTSNYSFQSITVIYNQSVLHLFKLNISTHASFRPQQFQTRSQTFGNFGYSVQKLVFFTSVSFSNIIHLIFQFFVF